MGLLKGFLWFIFKYNTQSIKCKTLKCPLNWFHKYRQLVQDILAQKSVFSPLSDEKPHPKLSLVTVQIIYSTAGRRALFILTQELGLTQEPGILFSPRFFSYHQIWALVSPSLQPPPFSLFASLFYRNHFVTIYIAVGAMHLCLTDAL